MLLPLVSGLIDKKNRMSAASDLAAYFGYKNLVIFISDPEIGILLPAPGFPQTIPDGEAWYKFLSETLKAGYQKGLLSFPDKFNLLNAVGISGPGNSAAVLLGDITPQADLLEMKQILPVLVTLFAKEQALMSALTRTTLAEKAAARAEKLTQTIDLMRRNLNDALITQEKDKKDIEDLMKKKDEFMDVASHELKTPLTSMKAYLQISHKMITKGDSLAGKFVEQANTQVDKLTDLVNDLFDVSKIQAGQMVYNFYAVDISEVIDEIVSQVQVGVSTHQIMVEHTVHAIINGDRHRLEQVVGNFLSNAIKYSPDARKIAIRSDVIDSAVRVTVTDFGIGIQADKLAFVFDRFYRVQSTSQKFPGLGIGLYICAEIINRHGGTVGVTSDKNGTAFYFEIPIVELKRKI